MDLRHELGFDPERLAADADHLFQRMRDLHAQPESVARAESDDGRVTVECGSTSGVRKLHLDPRAMRMSSADLAETVVELIHRARQRAEAEARAAAEAFGGYGPLAADRLRATSGDLRQNLEHAAATIDRLRALLRP
ncbi:YbaB/EbfC family nucleoid-associated protein [Nonomuraea jiangxiensis]|uniref:YbaB/EbfC DNA-binding family protein n=1 Tax=Nonomuraea jiangxiensis TaxID=633440 RepID=A0A1G8EKK1_9ACTN|nr:YbaB/EbfC family nucleoid-associated protein [Nonomuraea jiangxiensis]SDH70473.1 YbaB/EbfC DNA-binding family protein [Nonomuraea jiangxiensis]